MMNEPESELSRDELLARYASQPAARRSEATRRSPFKFLDSYEIDDADIFFGRDAEIDELLRHFYGYGHVLIYGESGSGKSSLVQCGLRSRIPTADALFIPLRLHATGLPGLCDQIRESAAVAIRQPIEAELGLNLIDTLRVVGEAASRPIVLFFDQFEELFIFHDTKDRRRFADDLASIARAKLNVKVVIGVRQDFLAELSELEEIVEGLFDNRFWLRRMSRENAIRAVVQACSTCDVKIDTNLADSLLHRLDPSGQGIELPYLQVVMDRLYRQAVGEDPEDPEITTEHVKELGDIANILGAFLIEEVEKLPAPGTGRQILKAFVTREKTRRTLDHAALAKEAAGFGEAIPPDVLDAHLNQLVSGRILRDYAETGSYELRHDALAATVSSWISEIEKELIEVRDNLINRFKEYEARGGQTSALLDQSFIDYLSVYRKRLLPLLSDDQSRYLQSSEQRLRRAKQLRQISLAGSIAAVLLLVVAGWMYLQYRDAKEAREREAIASKQLAFAKQAVNEMLSEVGSDTLKDVPQMEGVRAVLLDKALTLFEEIGSGDETGRFETAVAHYQVGEIQRILGENLDVAESAYGETIDQLEALCDEFPDDPKYWRQLGLSHMWLGESYRAAANASSVGQSSKQYEKAIAIQRKLAKSGDGQHQVDLARSLMNRGISHKNQHHYAEAMSDYREAERLLNASADQELSDALDEERQVLLSKTHLNRGVLLKSQLDANDLDPDLFRDAKSAYLSAIGELNDVIANRRTRQLPDRLEHSLNLAKYHNNLAIVLFQFDPNAKDDAESHVARAVTLGKSLNVGTRQVRIDLANYYNTTAQMLIEDQKPNLAIAPWQNAVAVMESVLSQDSEDQLAREKKLKYELQIEEARCRQAQQDAAD